MQLNISLTIKRTFENLSTSIYIYTYVIVIITLFRIGNNDSL